MSSRSSVERRSWVRFLLGTQIFSLSHARVTLITSLFKRQNGLRPWVTLGLYIAIIQLIALGPAKLGNIVAETLFLAMFSGMTKLAESKQNVLLLRWLKAEKYEKQKPSICRATWTNLLCDKLWVWWKTSNKAKIYCSSRPPLYFSPQLSSRTRNKNVCCRLKKVVAKSREAGLL